MYKIQVDGTNRECVLQGNDVDQAALNFNVTNDWIYYTNWRDNANIYRIRTNGTGNERINSDVSNVTTITKDWIYYVVFDPRYAQLDFFEDSELWRMRFDGSDRQKVN